MCLNADYCDRLAARLPTRPPASLPEASTLVLLFGETACLVSYRSEGSTQVKNAPTSLAADASDTKDFGVTEKARDRAQRARIVRRTRNSLGLSQSEFATRFRVPVGTLRDWEQACVTAPDFAVA